MNSRFTKGPDLEITLCPKCASVYYSDPSYWIERSDSFQTIHEECMLCKNPHGYNFRIWNNTNVQTARRGRIRTFVEGDCDE